MSSILNKNKTDKLLFWIAVFIMAAGILARLVILLQNRNLIIDECNIARNIYERGFVGLCHPLSYDQYAPPVFLWMLKLFTGIFGMGEQVLRLYSFLTSIGAIIFLYLVLKELTSLRSLWYPLALFVVGQVMIRYSTEAKQYMPDVFITLLLIWLALKVSIRDMPAYKFLALWFFIGSAVIWSSMPAVFMLAGVGLYYGYIAIQHKKYKKVALVVAISLLWLLQFLFYYKTILQPQIASSYLQQFHKEYFLYALPLHLSQWLHNYNVLAAILGAAADYHTLAMVFNILLLFLAIMVLLNKQRAVGILIITPLIAVVIAAMAHQFSLIPRVALFVTPLLLVLIGYGFELFMTVRFLVWRLMMVVIAFICIVNQNSVPKMIGSHFSTEDFTAGLRFFKEQNISGDRLYIHVGSVPAWIYYTQISPDRAKWAGFRDAQPLAWNVNYDSLATNAVGKRGLIFTSVYGDERTRISSIMGTHLTVIAKLDDQEKHRVFAYVYEKK